MKRFLFFILTSIFYANSFSQLLDINKPLFSDDPFFNSSFIKENEIKTITGSRSSKKIQDIIRAKGLDYFYEFNIDGNLIHQVSTFFINGQNKDTNIISYQYDQFNNLILRRKSDNYGFFSHQFLFDSLNRIIKKTYNREENALNCKGNFELCKRFKISSDSFSYQQLTKSQIKKKYYNNYGKPYKQQFIYLNDFGYTIETNTKYLIGNNKSKTTYRYNENGWLIEKSESTTLTGNKKNTVKYDYDNIGNMLEIQHFSEDVMITKKQFLYDKKTMLITAQIIQDMSSGYLQIIQYQYSFY